MSRGATIKYFVATSPTSRDVGLICSGEAEGLGPQVGTLTLAGWRVHPPDERRLKMKIISTALMALGLLLLSGCTPQTPSITDKDLIGTWKEQATPYYLQFNQDGTYSFAVAIANLGDNPDFEVGQFRLEGELLTFVSSDESPDCASESGTYEVQLTEKGLLKFTLREDPCEIRANFYRRSTWQPVSP